MSQIYVFMGENTFLLLQEKQRWIRGFAEKHGQENLQRVPGKGLDFRTLMDEVSSAPFLAERRLVVIEGMPKFDKDQIEMMLSQIHPQVLLLVVDEKPDKRLGGVKTLLQKAEVKSFDPLQAPALRSWMASYASEHGAVFAQGADLYLLDSVGEQQDLLAQEILKMSVYTQDGIITKEHIDLLVVSSMQQAGWKLLDYLAQGKTKEAMQFANKLLERGESPHALWSMLTWMVTSFASVYAAIEQGDTSPKSVAATSGVNFMSVRTLLPLARSTSKQQVASLITLCAEAEKDLKTGAIRSTADAPEEMLALLDHCVYHFANRSTDFQSV